MPYSYNNLASQLALCAPMSVFGGCNGAAFGSGPASFANRVEGQDPFTVDLNSDYDPNKTFVLNPKAWVDPPAGQFGSSAAYYSDYRYARMPSESFSFGRMFRFGDKASLQVRIELTNMSTGPTTQPPLQRTQTRRR